MTSVLALLAGILAGGLAACFYQMRHISRQLQSQLAATQALMKEQKASTDTLRDIRTLLAADKTASALENIRVLLACDLSEIQNTLQESTARPSPLVGV